MNLKSFVLASLLAVGCVPPAEDTASQQSALFGSDACKNVEIRVHNEFDINGDHRDIKVFSFEYYSASEGNWYTEDVSNLEVPAYAYQTFYNQDLQYAENDLITQWKVHFKYKEYDGDWSDMQIHTVNTTDTICIADTMFDLELN